MTDLGPLYHWSPRDRLPSIKRLGLVPGRRNIEGPTYHDAERPELGEFRQPAICTSPDPATAWAYSHGSWRSTGVFDLWQFSLVDTDEVEVRTMWGSRVVEVRVHGRVRKSRLVWVGERSTLD